MIKIGVKGKILSGRHSGWYIMVEPSEPTGSDADPYYIFYSSDFDFEKTRYGFDDMVEDFESVEYYFRVKKLEVEWLEDSEGNPDKDGQNPI
jgi:hypothetical protein